MFDQSDGIAIILAGRFYLYHLLQHIFGHEPSLKLLELASGEHTREVLELFSLSDVGEFAPYLELLDDLKCQISADANGLLNQLKSEYTYLMLGPGKLPASPWESVYVTKERLIFQESTLKVRRFYLKYRLLPAGYPHVADDHIAMELDFMSHLSQMSQESIDEENAEKLEMLLSDQKMFLEEHMLNWVGEFALQIQSAKTHYFYPQMAALTELILRTDYAVLGELLSVIENEKERCGT